MGFGGTQRVVRNKKRSRSSKASKAVTSQDKDVEMRTTKVKKRIRKTVRRAMSDAKVAELAKQPPGNESRKNRRQRIATAAFAAGSLRQSETLAQLQERHAAEWKAMKAKVALLKKERRGQPSKGGNPERRATSQAIRLLMEETQVRHVAERRALDASGVVPVSAGVMSDS
mmetsp:Transcript_14502/g.26680  ORF Transcript_14502/g.26680 Transcript_14502/m.26680 type:complete len:171 (-) Transcript_14502:26-538(-)